MVQQVVRCKPQPAGYVVAHTNTHTHTHTQLVKMAYRTNGLFLLAERLFSPCPIGRSDQRLESVSDHRERGEKGERREREWREGEERRDVGTCRRRHENRQRRHRAGKTV